MGYLYPLPYGPFSLCNYRWKRDAFAPPPFTIESAEGDYQGYSAAYPGYVPFDPNHSYVLMPYPRRGYARRILSYLGRLTQTYLPRAFREKYAGADSLRAIHPGLNIEDRLALLIRKERLAMFPDGCSLAGTCICPACVGPN